MLRTHRRNEDGVAVEDDVSDAGAEPLLDDLWISPSDRRRDSWRWRRHVARCELHGSPNQQFRRPCRERDGSFGTKHAEHLGDRDFGTRSEYVRELADDDIELGIGKGKLLHV